MPTKEKVSSPEMARLASQVLRQKGTSKKAKSLAASVLSQARRRKK